jgi:myo-inositol-1(or 4)-monophosphatase
MIANRAPSVPSQDSSSVPPVPWARRVPIATEADFVDIDLNSLAQGAVSAAVEAGDVALKSLGSHPGSVSKGPYDLQVDADIETEQAIVPRLKALLPGSEIASEEATAPVDWTNPSVWIIDPLDGTNNYYSAIPYMAVSIALRHHQRLVMAVVHDPVLNNSFSACLGRGAFQGNQILHAGPGRELNRATVSLVNDYSPDGRKDGQQIYQHLNSFVRRVTMLWAPAADLVRVATGHLDAMVCINALYGDVCSGLFILAEANGVILGHDGQGIDVAHIDPATPVSFIASASRSLADQLVHRLSPALAGAGVEF